MNPYRDRDGRTISWPHVPNVQNITSWDVLPYSTSPPWIKAMTNEEFQLHVVSQLSLIRIKLDHIVNIVIDMNVRSTVDDDDMDEAVARLEREALPK